MSGKAVFAFILLPWPWRVESFQCTASISASDWPCRCSAEVFRIEPARPIDELRREASQQSPPKETGAFRPSELIDVAALDVSIRLDVRYAGKDNFLSTPVYESAAAFLQKPAAEALVRAHRRLKDFGLESYPRRVPPLARLLDLLGGDADESAGIRRQPRARIETQPRLRGRRDTLRPEDGRRRDDIPLRRDEREIFPDYPGGTARQRELRELLREAMEAEGFMVYAFEWWHFDYQDWRHYPIGNQTLEQLHARR